MKVTTNLILETMHEWVENKHNVAPHQWLDASLKLTVLMSEEHDKLYNHQSNLAKMKAAYIEEGKTSAAANILIEAEDEYLEMQKQKGKVKQIEEFIRISKIQARLKDNEMTFQS